MLLVLLVAINLEVKRKVVVLRDARGGGGMVGVVVVVVVVEKVLFGVTVCVVCASDRALSV